MASHAHHPRMPSGWGSSGGAEARYPIGCGSSSVRGMLLSVSKCRTLLSVLSFSLSHSVGYTSVGWLGRDSDS
eukprot:COSAG06_NODE_64338_length_259_cov_53.881250_1_plen_72_part_01